ncbi:MAG TPA: UxaA family hydrolase [Candidatus Polarisedimenticolia bacterium]|nr:UxaA family hydrolase [Candidatus Polarisedimenticolia bacterium]
METVNLEDVAIVGRPASDNVAVVAVDFLDRGTQLRYSDRLITMIRRAQRGQSFAIQSIPKGEPYITLGDPFGIAAQTMQPGDSIEEEDFAAELPQLEVSYRENPSAATVPELAARTFDGYVRDDGTVGTRNLVGIVTSGMCSSTEAREIAWRAMHEIYSREKYPNVDGVVAVVHESGCGMPDGAGLTLLNLLLTNTLKHPNLGSAIYLDLGCGKTCVECSVPLFQNRIPNYNQRVVNMTVQQQGGSRKTILKGLEVIEGLLEYTNKFSRKPVSISNLIVGTKCGGSDRWSGLTANPAVGVAADMFVKAGGAVFLPEIPELQGAAMIDLVRRARNPQVGHKLMDSLDRFQKYVELFGENFAENPTPGNKKGGLYNIYLKSTGAKAKGGTTTVEGLLEYGEWLGKRRGLYVLYTPGYDQLSTPALFLSGAQVALFTTGRGTGIGNALGPVVKVSSNTLLWKNNEDMDINAGTVLDRTETVEDVGRRIFEETITVASGQKTVAEQSGIHNEFKVWESLWPAL